jgi:nucleoside phosphorylase
MAGIAFGSDRSKHRPGDVLVAQHIIPYEAQRQGAEVEFRNPVPPASGALLNRFRNVLKWSFQRPDGMTCKVHYGAILSGEKLIDDKSFKQSLLEQYPTAIGGEMEGAGLWASADRNRKEWLVVKGVCDWADGEKNDDYQELAAAASISLCEEVFQNPHALAGL